MTRSNQPPFLPDALSNYQSAADDYAPSLLRSDEDKEDEEDDGSSSGEGGGKGRSLKDYNVVLDPVIEFADDRALSDEKNAAQKLRKLGISPMSYLIYGGSALASENDLSRKVFMANVGLRNLEIQPRDIASPHLFEQLDQKQTERRGVFGIKTLDEIISGAVGAAGLAVGAIAGSVADFVKDKREERRLEQQAKSYHAGAVSAYALNGEEIVESVASTQEADFPVQENQAIDWNDVDDDSRDEKLSRVIDVIQSYSDDDPVISPPVAPLEPLASFADIIAVEDRYKGQATSQPTGDLPVVQVFNAVADLRASEPLQTVQLERVIDFRHEPMLP
jgi:hypothetical protein